MEIQESIDQLKEIYIQLLAFIEDSESDNKVPNDLLKLFTKQEFLTNQMQLTKFIEIIVSIATNHYRNSGFFERIENILFQIKGSIQKFSNDQIYELFKTSIPLLQYLVEQKILQIDENITKKIKIDNNSEFFIPELEKSTENDENYEEIKQKRQIGENDSKLCKLIREDLADEFIPYVNLNKISLLSEINPSIYETHPFIKGKKMTLIEYASFFGSIQIVRYLKFNKVPLNEELWFYSVHSNNGEFIHFLEENHVNLSDKSIGKILMLSINCHHNDLACYIENNMITAKNKLKIYSENLNECILNSHNYYFYPNNIDDLISSNNFCYKFTMRDLCDSVKILTIPSTVNKIVDNAFKNCKSLEKIIIPSSVISIGSNAFCSCSSLKEIEIPSSVKSIGNFAFLFCSSLEKIEIPSSLTMIKDYTFKGCSSLKEVTIPSSVKSIGIYSFNKCSSLLKISIPSSVNSIGSNIFSECSSLEDISISSSIKSISCNAFNECKSLKEIIIPSSVKSISFNAFNGCNSLAKITIPSSVTSFGNGIFKGVESLEILGDMKKIPENMFMNCTTLKRIVLPDSIEIIEKYAFYGCSSLKEIIIPSNVTSIACNAFDNCTSLRQISIPPSLVSIGNYAFNRCSSLVQISIPSSVTSIGNNAFNECSSLEQISIPSSLNINNIKLNSNVKVIKI